MKKIIYLSLFSILFASCNGTKIKKPTQYPEDPGPSNLSATERLINKKWVLKSVTLNGVEFIDSVHATNGKVEVELQNIKWNSTFTPPNSMKGNVITDTFGNEFVAWELIEEESIIRSIILGGFAGSNFHHFVMVPHCLYGLPTFNSAPLLIQKLTTNEFKISISNISGDSVLINKFESK